MIIFGFDCAIKNIGINIVQFNQLYNDQLQILNNELIDFISIKKSFTDFTIGVCDILDKMNELMSNVLKIIWFNNVNLIADANVADVPVIERICRIKTLLTQLDSIAKPDLVLVEYQMGPNDDMRCISNCIIYHYAHGNCQITFKMPILTPMQLTPTPTQLTPMQLIQPTIAMVMPSLKNKYNIAPNGSYSTFITKYSNYTANKKHTTFNYKYFIKTTHLNIYNIISNCKDKELYDIADSFMMIYSYLKKKRLI